MTTFLIALRFSPDLTHSLRETATRILSLYPKPADLPFPPLVPVLWTSGLPGESVLDTVRKTNPLTVDFSTSRVTVIPAAKTNHLVLTPEIAGFTALQETFERMVQRREPPLFPVGPHIFLAVLPQRRAHEENSPRIETDAVILRTARTSAVWLSAFTIQIRQQPWWTAISWQEWYSRRVTVKPGRPDSDPTSLPHRVLHPPLHSEQTHSRRSDTPRFPHSG